MSAMAAIALAPEEIPSVRDKVTPEEWQTRVDLAACYRLVDFYGMADMTETHIAARVPGEPNAFLLNPYGVFFEEITASSLVKIDVEGWEPKVIAGMEATLRANPNIILIMDLEPARIRSTGLSTRSSATR